MSLCERHYMNSYSIEKFTVHSIKFVTQVIALLFSLLYFYPAISMEEYETYPTPRFHNVEKICKDILLDIDALSFNIELKEVWIEQSNYFLNQFLVLSQAIDDLVDNKEECRAYLLEDLHYLQEVIILVENAYSALANKRLQTTTYSTMQTIIQESKTRLDSIYSLNQEVLIG